MKRILRLAFVLLCLTVAPVWAQSVTQDAPIPTLNSPVVDTTGTLDASQLSALQQQALDLQKRKGAQLQVLVVPTTQPEDIEQYTQRVFDQWKLGRKEVDDAVLLVVAKDDRRVRIQTGYGLEGAIPDAIANRIIQEYMVPAFRQDDYAGGLREATGVLVGLIDGEQLPAPQSSHKPQGGRGGESIIFGLIAGIFAANAVRVVFQKASKSTRMIASGVIGGGVAWLFSSFLLVGGIAGVIGLLMGLMGKVGGGGIYMGGFGGGRGGFGGGGFGGGGFGGWGGGGGSSGGGGASGGW